MTPYNANFARSDNVIRDNHGKPWTSTMERTLIDLFIQGTPMKEIAETLGRKGDSILTRLRHLNLVEGDSYTWEYHITPRGQQLVNKTAHLVDPSADIPQAPKEPTMNDTTKTIETKTFILGADAAQMSDAQIFSLIAKKEQEIEKLRSIKVASSKLAAAISALQDDVQHLAEFVDARP